jgi:hypothetical protein
VSTRFELFYTIADADSASARKAVMELGLLAATRFRNLAYPEVKADYAARGGTAIPALWDGAALHQGLDAVLAVLKTRS